MRVKIQAPLSGVVVPLEQVPDPVFSQKMVGDGLAIDPIDQRLVAPFDGKVVQLHPAQHAVTLCSGDGLELLMHVGLDTVKLKGEGFTAKVKLGESVKAGDVLIEFSADQIARRAKSLLTMVLITNGAMASGLQYGKGMVSASKDMVLELDWKLEDGGSAEDGEEVSSEAIVVPNPTGLHARPAAVLVNLTRRYDAQVTLWKGEEKANARSLVAILGLEIGNGESVRLVARGPEARQAIADLSKEVAAGLGEEGAAPAPASTVLAEPVVAPRAKSENPDEYLGVGASDGVVVGNIFQLRQQELDVPKESKLTPQQEDVALRKALAQAKGQLEALGARLHAEAEPAKAAIFAAHQELLEDPDLLEPAEAAIAKGNTAAYAWQRAYTTHSERLAALRNELLAARANDLRDVGRRVLGLILGTESVEVVVPEKTILVAEDLTPSDTATLDREKVLGFATTTGGATSHVAILARSLGLPAVAGIDPQALEVPNGTRAILNGNKGTLRCNPPDDVVEQIEGLRQRLAERRAAQLEKAHEPARCKDGHRVEVVVNIGGVSDAEECLALGAEGVGLLRSEFLFLERPYPPTEAEQFDCYSAIAKAIGPDRPMVLRTLDVGGDKPLAYLPIPHEDNPFLGQRGIRVLLNRPDVFRPQLRAALRAAEFGNMHIMFPMVASMAEWRAAKAALEAEREALGIAPVKVGIMIEIPAAALIAEQFAKEVDFFSIGTNDLTQYTLAMDRGHPQLAADIDGLSPAVLRLIERTVDAAHTFGKWVGVCGGIAGEAAAVPILVGLGVDELSVSLPLVPAVKARVRQFSFEQCKELAQKALRLESAAAVRALCPDPLGEGDIQ
ncbi:MAG: phosphoenolpyruvate--protein phosphotransferase [Vulcanimicrobiota bacterium]